MRKHPEKIAYQNVILSEGGTGEDRRIDPHLNFGTTIVIIFGKIGSDRPPLDKKNFRSSPR